MTQNPAQSSAEAETRRQAPLYACLVHFPISDKHGAVVATSVTNLDIHDIARSARTFGVTRYFIVTPVESHHWLTRRIIGHWREGWGATYNPNRKEALSVVSVVSDLAEVSDTIAAEAGEPPVWVGTSARHYPNSVTFGELRARRVTEPSQPLCLVFGTGHGLHPEILADCDLILEPIRGASAFNHLPVRAAAAIIFDRLLNGGDPPPPPDAPPAANV